jgi:adenine phosphoribosyltransferase
MDLSQKIRNIPDFPTPGVQFKDITTLLKDPEAFKYTIDVFTQYAKEREPDLIVAVESRGFIFAAPIAERLGAGFVPVRKPGKLPALTTKIEYELEYGKGVLEIHTDAIEPGQRVLIVDDVLATGGTIEATRKLVEQFGGKVVGFAFLMELEFLKGRERLKDYDVLSLVKCQ